MIDVALINAKKWLNLVKKNKKKYVKIKIIHLVNLFKKEFDQKKTLQTESKTGDNNYIYAKYNLYAFIS
jgi:hypothetical protein